MSGVDRRSKTPRPSTAAPMLDAQDGAGLLRIRDELWEKLREREIALSAGSMEAVQCADMLRSLRNATEYYAAKHLFHSWPAGVTMASPEMDAAQLVPRRMFTELCRCIWVALDGSRALLQRAGSTESE